MRNSFRYILTPLIFIALMAIESQHLTAQVDCDISINSELPVCPNGIYTLSVPFNTDYSYEWTKNGVELEDTDNEITDSIGAQTTYGINVTNTVTSETCSNNLIVTVREDFTVEFTQWQLTCSNGDEDNGNTAKVQAFAIGPDPSEDYTYKWNVDPIQIAPGTPSLAVGLKAHLFYDIEIISKNGCSKKERYWTESYGNPDIEVFADPDTAYIQNPFITFSYNNLSADSIGISNHFWNFGDESETSDLMTPTHRYLEEGSYITELTVYNDFGCDTIYFHEVLIKPVKLFIPNVFTPNADGVNDTFIITEDEGTSEEGDLKSSSAFEYESYDPLELYYQRSELHIFNRWGRIVYQSENYQNDWDGSNLPDGVYFYVLKCYGAKSDDVFKGSVSIYGSGR